MKHHKSKRKRIKMTQRGVRCSDCPFKLLRDTERNTYAVSAYPQRHKEINNNRKRIDNKKIISHLFSQNIIKS